MSTKRSDPTSLAPWRPYSDVKGMPEEGLGKYYEEIYGSSDGLSPIQRVCIDNHTADVQFAARTRTKKASLKTSRSLAILRYASNFLAHVLRTVLCDLLLLTTDPLHWAYALVSYGSIFGGLFVMQSWFLVKQAFAGSLDKPVDHAFFEGQSKASAVCAASVILGSASPFVQVPPDPSHPHDRTRSRTRPDDILCDLDVAKAMLVLSALIYARETEWVRKAKAVRDKAHFVDTRNYLLRSQELIYSTAKRFGLQFTSISDFSTDSGAFVGAFWKIDGLAPGQHPFVIVVFKGTTSSNMSEWTVDCSFKLESASDYLASGYAHSGFYSSVFPAPSTVATDWSPTNPLTKMRILPYKRITNAIQLIAYEAAKKTGLALQVWTSGHSLGAGLASLFYARLLESPRDVDVPDRTLADGTVVKGVDVDVRDAYVFGCPRTCSADLASRVEYNLRKPENVGRMMFRICNKDRSPRYGDLVTHVPPGLCDERRVRASVRAGSLLSYSAMGLRIDLTPSTSVSSSPIKDRHFRLGPVPLGCKVDLVSRLPASERDEQRPEVKGLMRYLPWLTDHKWTSYWYSLSRVEPRHIEMDKRGGSWRGVKCKVGNGRKDGDVDPLESPTYDLASILDEI